MYKADGAGPEYVFDTHDHHGAVTVMMSKKENSAAHLIWPVRHAGEGVRTKVVRADEEHPGLIGLRTYREPSDKDNYDSSSVRGPDVVWMDPARNYVIVETISQGTDEGRRYVRRKICEEFAQLPDGRWYPETWRVISEHYDKDGEQIRSNQRRFVLQILVGQTLDDVWFTNPTSRLSE
jgi:hypothetical protein